MTHFAFLLACLAASPDAAEPARVLFLTHSAGYRHEVVARPSPDELSLAEARLVDASRGRFDVVATQDCGAISAENLARFRAVVFYTTGELPVPEGGREALVDWVRAGGGFVGIHCATDTLYEFAPYHEMIAATFDGHPWHQEVGVVVEDREHPATRHLGESFRITDEIYQFRDWDPARAQVLLRLDTAGLDRAEEGRAYPLSWCRAFGQGRVFYTALGHRSEVWQDERFMTHLLEGIGWAATRTMRAADDEGFEPLLDADHTEGWAQAGPGGFDVADGVATPHGGMGLWYYERRSFRNFVLRLEFQQDRIESNSGVYVRFPRVEGDPWIPVREGYEVQIAGDQPSTHSTGAIYDFQGATAVPLKPAGEWNEYEIACVGSQYTVRLNGRAINVFTGDRSAVGMIGLQNHADEDVVRYRNIRVRELPDDATAYRVLFDGSGVEGWHMAGPGGFDVADGAVTSQGGMGLFWHEREFDDFVLLLDWKVSRREDNSGVFVRFPDPGNDPWIAVNQGYEIQVSDLDPPAHRTGSIYNFQDSTSIPTRDVGEWNRMEIEVRGQHYVVRVNGVQVNDYVGERSEAGRVGFQNHDNASRVSYRNVRVVELAPLRK